jgi:uncharacterized phage protein gp47/JayE
MSFGVTPQGFVKKTYNDIFDELSSLAKQPEYFGSDVDLTPYGEIGLFIQLMAKVGEEAWDTLEDVYYANDIDSAEGVQLDRKVAIGGISRRPSVKATVQQVVYADDGTTIPEGYLFQTPQGVQFENVESTSAFASGTSMLFRAVLAGAEGVVVENSINEIVNPLSGVASGTNPTASSGGLAIETDAELRARYKERSSAGGSTVSAIRDRVLQVPNIGVVFVFENYANFEVDGRPPHSIEVVVSGSATDEDIATAIYESKAGGIEPVGTESYSVTDENGIPQEMRWSLASEILVNVKVFIATNSDWVSTNEEVIRRLIIQYVGGVYTEGLTATNYPGLGAGKDVLAWGIESKFDGIVGIEDIEVFIALSPTVPSTLRKVSIIDTNYARVDNSNVTFSIT